MDNPDYLIDAEQHSPSCQQGGRRAYWMVPSSNRVTAITVTSRSLHNPHLQHEVAPTSTAASSSWRQEQTTF